ncbi:MAG: hypothetical protein HC770_05930 [Pseudanabaena sp. CRU_2_10]|nr:hypothetical protein [Pseudanabaena sp. CRU_2_10]
MSSDRKGSAKSKILVADDLSDNRLYLSAVLERQGYEVRCLSFEQVSLVQQEAGLSDLILLNINAENERSHAIWQELKDACLTAQIP